MSSEKTYKYKFYFEVNSFNLNRICSKENKTKSFKGYNIGQENASSNYPITGNIEVHEDGSTKMVNPQKMTMKTTGKLTLKDFPVPSNTFMLWDELVGKDYYAITCTKNMKGNYQFPTFPDNGHNHKCSNNPCMFGYVHNHGWHNILHTWHCAKSTAYACDSKLDSDSYGFAYRTRGYSNYPNPENGLLTAKFIRSNTNCQGLQCSEWFPPSENIPVSTDCYQTPSFMPGMYIHCTHTGKNCPNGCCDPCDNAKLINAVLPCGLSNPAKKPLIVSGNPTFTYNVYIPIDYKGQPLFINGVYQPLPSNSMKGYYNNAPLNTKLEKATITVMDAKVVTEQPSVTVNNKIIPGEEFNSSNSINYTFTLPKKSYAIYSVEYTLKESDFTKELGYKILDLLYLQQSLFNTFSVDFKNSCYWKSSTAYLNQLIIDYCQKTGDMSLPLCSNKYLPFSFQNKSPCSENFSTCAEGWDKFCSQDANYNSDSCLNYYSNSYDKNNLYPSVISDLKQMCGNIYNQETDKDNLSNDFYDICGCYLPEEVYKNSSKDNDELTYENRQCWYLPCINSSILPSINPKCPDNEIINCIQRQYITTENTQTGKESTKMTESSIKKCNSESEKKEKMTPNITENFTMDITNQDNKKIIDSILIIIVIILLFVNCFWKK